MLFRSRIVTISSSSAQSGGPDRAHYIASKGGVIALTKALAFDFSPQGITANTIPPSIIATPMADTAVQAGLLPKLDDLAMMTPVRRTGLPEDIAAAAVFLCSEQAGFITGQVIGVNGAAARLVQKNDLVIVVTYCQMAAEEARNYAPTVVLLDEGNLIKKAA